MADFAFWAGQFFGLLSLLLCIWAFSCKQDDRLLMLLLSANVAFALQFLCLGSWKEENPKGDCVVVTMNGKFLPYKAW
ncbi:MAG TPA: YgjV family protein [Marinobacter sp.]|nr:YgjV family protein [Marinobacter sp.]